MIDQNRIREKIPLTTSLLELIAWLNSKHFRLLLPDLWIPLSEIRCEPQSLALIVQEDEHKV
jgi:hypothetical protein